MGWIREAHTKGLEEVNDNLSKVVAQQEHERERRSMQNEKLNIARHQKTNEAKVRVLREWEKNPSSWSSAEKAGNHFADQLVKDGILGNIEPRTVIGWIRTHARQIGVKLR